jgi:hypothetical protein
MTIHTNNKTHDSPLATRVTQPPPADLRDATDGDIVETRVEIWNHKSAQQIKETHAQTSLEAQPENELKRDQPSQTPDSAQLNKKEAMEQQDINDKPDSEERRNRFMTGPKSTTFTPHNTAHSMSADEGEWGVMETETPKLKQDGHNDESPQQPKRQKKTIKQEEMLTPVTEHTNIVTGSNTTKTGRI